MSKSGRDACPSSWTARMCRSTSAPSCAISPLTPIFPVRAWRSWRSPPTRTLRVSWPNSPGAPRPFFSPICRDRAGAARQSSCRRLRSSLGLTSEVEPDAKRALKRGLELARQANAWLLVTGSLYLVGALRPRDRRGGPNAGWSRRGARPRARRLSAATAGPADGAQFPAHDEGAVGAVDRLRLLGLSSRTGGRPRRHARGRGRARGHADGQRQVASLPAPCDRPRRPHFGGFAADRADARPGRPIARGRRRGGKPQFLLRSRRTPEGRARPRRAFAPTSLYRARTAVARRHDRRLEEGEGRSSRHRRGALRLAMGSRFPP